MTVSTKSSSLEEKWPVDEAAGDPDRARDLLDRRLLHPALVEQGAGRRDELALANLLQRLVSSAAMGQ